MNVQSREQSSWWLRNICNIILLANAGGVVTLVGFASNIDSIDIAIHIAYPAIIYFLMGGGLAVVFPLIMFIYTCFNLEAIADADEATISNGINKINVPALITFIVLIALFVFSAWMSVSYFLKGVSHVSQSTSSLACAIDDRASYCKNGVSIFDKPSPQMVQKMKTALEGEGKGKALPVEAAIPNVEKREQPIVPSLTKQQDINEDTPLSRGASRSVAPPNAPA